jgi:hypothetical protein
LSSTNAEITATAITMWILPREQLYSMERLVNVAYQVTATESNTLSCGFTPAENNALTFGYGRQDGFFGAAAWPGCLLARLLA